MHTVPLLINGEDVTSSTAFDIINPGSGETQFKAYGADAELAKKAVDAAAAAFPAWSKTKPLKKRELFFKAAELLQQRADEVTQIQEQETSVDKGFAGGFQIMVSVGMLRECGARVSTIEGSIPEPDEEGGMALVIKEPYGVVVGMAPWNAALLLGLRAVCAPIACGNTVVLKASELSPGTHNFIGRIFRDAGFPPGVLNIIQHRREDAPPVVESLIAHPATRKINFTGSTPVGSIIAKLAGQYLKPVLLELGGKAPLIVLQDADLELAAKTAVAGAWAHQGQICMSTEKIIVLKSIASKFRTALLSAARSLTGMSGPNAMSSTVTKVQSLVSDALSKGAVLEFGQNKLASGQQHLQQMLVGGVTKEMDIYHQETFGPVSTLIEVEDVEEAIRVANDTEYGLSASVFSRDLSLAIQVAKRIESGAVHINGNTVHDENSLPHGGWKKSGFGRFGSKYGFEEFLQTKTITIKFNEVL